MKKARGMKSGFPVFLSARCGKNPGNPPDIGYRLWKFLTRSAEREDEIEERDRDRGGQRLRRETPRPQSQSSQNVCTVQITRNTTHHKA